MQQNVKIMTEMIFLFVLTIFCKIPTVIIDQIYQKFFINSCTGCLFFYFTERHTEGKNQSMIEIRLVDRAAKAIV